VGDLRVFSTATEKVFMPDTMRAPDDDWGSGDERCETYDIPGAGFNALKLSMVPAEDKWVEVEDGVSLKRCASSLEPPT
jgi:hypothetical protein